MKKPMPTTPALEIVATSHYRQPPGTQPNARVIVEFLECVELVTGGRGWIRDGSTWREVLAGDLLWNSPSHETIGRSDESNPYSCLAVVFRVPKKNGRGIRRFSVWPDLQEVRRFTERTIAAFHDPHFDRRVLGDFVHGTLLYHSQCHAEAEKRLRYPFGIVAVLKEIEVNYASPLSLASLASVAGLSSTHLHNVFRDCTGTSPHQMLIERRLRAAKEMLLATNASVKETAHACGFGDSPAFVRTFKVAMGTTPAAFRSRYWSSSSLGHGRAARSEKI
jgi:AraC-like DNA-binding protein